jgi:peptide-methionine (S)-S-oxide reductase
MSILDFVIGRKDLSLPTAETALPGRTEALPTAEAHFVNHHALKGPYPEGSETALFGLGCFWGAEKAFWKIPGVWVTAVGYAGGITPNPTYREVCTGGTGHNEVVLVVFDPKQVSYAQLVKAFFEAHDPTQGMRQGNDVGTQYRSGIYVADAAQRKIAEAAKASYAQSLAAKGYGAITTEIVERPAFYFAEDYHQQYLARNPHGYCGLGGTGVACQIGTGVNVN